MDFQRSVEIVAEPDVLICGLGCAGTTAAIAAGRMGAKTVAIERWAFAGGNISAGHVAGCCGLADMTNGQLSAGGIALELLAATGAIKLPLKSTKLFEPIRDEKALANRHTKLPFFWDVEKFKIVADRMLAEQGVSLLYHTAVADVVVKGSRIEAVILAGKSGLRAIRPRMIIDCTGDADVAAWAGVPCEKHHELQPLSLIFHIGGVRGTQDRQAFMNKCANVLVQARKAGKLGIYGGPWISSPWQGIIRVNAVRLPFDSSDAKQLTAAEVRGRQDVWQMFELWKQTLPEFKEAYFMSSGPIAGPRESRRIVGQYTLTKEDIVAKRSFPDAIGKGSWYLDLHPADAPGYHPHYFIEAFQIPYRTLVPQKIDNLLVAGRCHSVTHEGLAATRVSMTAMVMGHAAGLAAFLATRASLPPAKVAIYELQQLLRQQRAVLDYD